MTHDVLISTFRSTQGLLGCCEAQDKQLEQFYKLRKCLTTTQEPMRGTKGSFDQKYGKVRGSQDKRGGKMKFEKKLDSAIKFYHAWDIQFYWNTKKHTYQIS